MTLWSGDTLERLADFKIPDNFYIHALSPKGDTALLMGLQSAELCLLTVPEGRELFRTEARQGWLHVEDYTGFTADGAYLYESLQRPVKGSDGTTQFRSRIHRRSDGKLISDVPDIFRPTMTFPDMRRVLVDSGTVGDLETSKELFDFERTADEESTSYEVLDIFPDNEHVLTVGKNHSMLVWKRVRPEWWWGHFWLWETYVLIGFSVAFLWSLLRRERPTFV